MSQVWLRSQKAKTSNRWQVPHFPNCKEIPNNSLVTSLYPNTHLKSIGNCSEVDGPRVCHTE